MSEARHLSARPYIPRAEVERQLLEPFDPARPADAAVIQIIHGPRGAGKSCLVRQIAARLAARGMVPVVVDLERIGTNPIDFAEKYTTRVAAAAGRPEFKSERIRQKLTEESARRKPDGSALLDLALSYPQVLAREIDRPLVLLLDELGEMAWLSNHSGLRDCLKILARRLAGAAPARVIATVSPASRPAPLLDLLRREGLTRRLDLPTLDRSELLGLLKAWGCAPAEQEQDGPAPLDLWVKATNGHPLYVEILARRVASGEDLASALAAEMTPPLGALFQECRFDYHMLVERSRGHAAVRRILDLLSREEGLHLSGIAQHLRISLPTALDYLSWLLEVGLIRRDGRGYVFADPLLRLWVTLNGPEPAEPLEQAVAFLKRPAPAPMPPSRPRGRRPRPLAPAAVTSQIAPEASAAAPPQDKADLMIEID